MLTLNSDRTEARLIRANAERDKLRRARQDMH